MVSYINKTEVVGTTAVNVLPDRTALNEQRTALIITNSSTAGQVITLSIDSQAVDNQGIILYPGGSWEQTANSGYLPPQKRISAISDAAAGQLSIYEEAQ